MKNASIEALFSGMLLCAACISCGDGPVDYAQNFVPNRAPVIQSFISDFPVGTTPEPGTTCTVTVTTEDPDGDPVAVAFTSGNGSFSGQTTTGNVTTVTFIVGNIGGSTSVSINVTATDPKGSAAAQSLDLGTSATGPMITVISPSFGEGGSGKVVVGSDGYASIIFRSSCDGLCQVSIDDNGGLIDAPIFDYDCLFFWVKKDTDRRVDICGPTYSGPHYSDGIPRLFTPGNPDRVCIIVQDTMLQKSWAGMTFEVTGKSPDPGGTSGSTIHVNDITKNGCTLTWAKGDDGLETPVADLRYKVFRSLSGNISTPAEAEANGIALCDWTADIDTLDVTGLTAGTLYYFNVLVKDLDDVVAGYDMKEAWTLDGLPPAPGGSGKISESAVADDSLTLSWTKAVDNTGGSPQDKLQYRVYRSDNPDIADVAGMEMAMPVTGWLTDIASCNVSSLADAWKKYYNVMVCDELGNKAAYTMVRRPAISSFTASRKTILTSGGGHVQISAGLTVAASDPDGGVLSYLYEKKSGGGDLTGPDAATGKIFSASTTAGTVTLRATVTDDSGAIDKAELSINVRDNGYERSTVPVSGSAFGVSTANIGDLNDDGVDDLAVGAYYDDQGEINMGAVWILFMNSNGGFSIPPSTKITDFFTLGEESQFGVSVANLGIVNGYTTIAAGAHHWGTKAGAAYILSLKSDGTVNSVLELICGFTDNFSGVIAGNDLFGSSVASLGDLNGDGKREIAVGSQGYYNGGGKGAEYIISLNTDWSISAHKRISTGEDGFTGALDAGDWFGSGAADLGYLGTKRAIVVGAPLDDDGVGNTGAVWILFLNADGTVSGYQKISATTGVVTGGGLAGLAAGDRFGFSIADMGDMNGDGDKEIAVGATGNTGGVWMLTLHHEPGMEGKVQSYFKIDGPGEAGFGMGISRLGDLDGDGVPEVVVGSPWENSSDGAIYMYFMNADGTVLH